MPGIKVNDDEPFEIAKEDLKSNVRKPGFYQR